MISAPGTLPGHPYFRCKYNNFFVIPTSHFVIPSTIERSYPLKRE